MIKIKYHGSGIIQVYNDPNQRMTRPIFKDIVNECLEGAMTNWPRWEMAEIDCGAVTYFMHMDTWMEGSRVFGRLGIMKDGIVIYEKLYILAD